MIPALPPAPSYSGRIVKDPVLRSRVLVSDWCRSARFLPFRRYAACSWCWAGPARTRPGRRDGRGVAAAIAQEGRDGRCEDDEEQDNMTIPKISMPLWFSRCGYIDSGRNAQKEKISAIIGDMLKSVAVIVVPNFSIFEFGTACEVFGIDRSGRGGGVPDFDFRVCTPVPGNVRHEVGSLHEREPWLGGGSRCGPGDHDTLRPRGGRP